MQAKSQAQTKTSEAFAKEKLIIYVYEYLVLSGAKKAADSFLKDIRYDKDIKIHPSDTQGFLASWWCVFWDLYCATPNHRQMTETNQVEPSSEARAFQEFQSRSTSSSQSTSPSQPQIHQLQQLQHHQQQSLPYLQHNQRFHRDPNTLEGSSTITTAEPNDDSKNVYYY